MPLPALLSALLGTAQAAEVQFEGFYRARGRWFDTLSLARQGIPAGLASEGGTVYAQHRLWLAPRFVLSDQVALFTQFRGLDNVVWGRDSRAFDPFVGTVLPIYEYGLNAPVTADPDVDRGLASQEGSAPLLDFTLWRAYAEIHTNVGRFTFGRVPLHWGLGLWLNDGLRVDPVFADYGDTTDRLMWEYLANDQVYVRAAIDIPTERLIGANDDTTSFNAAVAYRSEDITAGILLQFDRTGNGRQEPALGDFNLFTVDAAADAQLGKLHAAAEFVGHFGGGDLEGVNGVALTEQNVIAIGAAGDVSLDLDPFMLAVRGGYASGDRNPNDGNRRTYAFDRDYSVGMFLFEQPLPTLAAPDGTRSFDEVRSGTVLANALFLAPTISRRLIDGLGARVTYLTARTAAGGLPDDPDNNPNNAGYGHELQLGVDYSGIEHLVFDARFGMFFPGQYFTAQQNFISGAVTETSFGAPAFGIQLTGRVEF